MRKSETPETPAVKLIGYARVSTADQSLQMQIDALIKAGVPERDIYKEQVSGVSTRRHQLGLALKRCRPGVTLVVWKLDRVGRSMLDLLKKLEFLERQGAGIRSLTDGFDTTTPAGRLTLHMLAALAQFERDLIVERTKAGVRAHIARGGKIGKERIMTEAALATARTMIKSGSTVREVAAHFKVKTATIYSYINSVELAALRKG